MNIPVSRNFLLGYGEERVLRASAHVLLYTQNMHFKENPKEIVPAPHRGQAGQKAANERLKREEKNTFFCTRRDKDC